MRVFSELNALRDECARRVVEARNACYFPVRLRLIQDRHWPAIAVSRIRELVTTKTSDPVAAL